MEMMFWRIKKQTELAIRISVIVLSNVFKNVIS